MSDSRTPILALSLDPAVCAPATAADPASWLALALSAERSGVSLVTLADTHRGTDGVPRLDALMLAAYLGARTERIGVVAAADVTVSEPYLLASQVATADFVSAGRAGWLLQVSGEVEDAGYVGPRDAATGDAAWEEAAEFVEVVRSLWDSWEDDAEIRDVAHQRFIDRDRIHHIAFRGDYLNVIGPSITPRPPQGQPPVVMTLNSSDAPRVTSLAMAQADVIALADDLDRADLADLADLRERAAADGRALRLLRDLPLAHADPAAVEAALSAGADGVRLIPSALPGDMARLAQLSAELGLDDAARAPVSTPAGAPLTLRDRLGLPRPANRHTAQLSVHGADGDRTGR